MAVSLLARDVSDLCLGKPALRSLSVSSTVAEALSALKRSSDPYLSVWSCNHSKNISNNNHETCRCIGKVCVVDVISYLCKEDNNLINIGKALQQPLSSLLVCKVSGVVVTHLEPHASLLEGIDLMIEGAQNLVIPIQSHFTRKKLVHKASSNGTLHNNKEYCWLTQEDVIRYLLNCIGLFSPIPNQTIKSLNIIDTESVLSVCYDEAASSALPLISGSLVRGTCVAIVDIEGKLIGEISPDALNLCDESVAAAIATLSAGELMAYVDCGEPPEELVQLVKERLEKRNLGAALELMEEDSSSSSDEEFGLGRSGSCRLHSSRVAAAARRTDAIVCFPWSSLVAVMIQAISHRVSYVWVIQQDGTLVGIANFTAMIKVFREHLKSML